MSFFFSAGFCTEIFGRCSFMFFGVDISLGTFSFFRIYFGRGFFSGFFCRTWISKISLVDVFLFIFLGRCFQSSFGRNCFSQFFGGDVFWCFGICSGYFVDVFLLKSLVRFFLNCLMGMSLENLWKRGRFMFYSKIGILRTNNATKII